MSNISTLTFPADATAADKVRAVCEALGLTMRAVFVPFSRSRNAEPRDGAKEPWRSLNWRVTLERAGRPFIETDYSQGEAYTPAYNAPAAAYARLPYTEKMARRMAISHEIETGKRAAWSFGGSRPTDGKPVDSPAIADVIMSLVLDSSVLNSGGFEEWASEHGYSTDSRSAETIYRACLETALKLRAAIGEAGIDALRTAGEDY